MSCIEFDAPQVLDDVAALQGFTAIMLQHQLPVAPQLKRLGTLSVIVADIDLVTAGTRLKPAVAQAFPRHARNAHAATIDVLLLQHCVSANGVAALVWQGPLTFIFIIPP